MKGLSKGRYDETLSGEDEDTNEKVDQSDKLAVRHHKREPRGQPFPSM